MAPRLVSTRRGGGQSGRRARRPSRLVLALLACLLAAPQPALAASAANSQQPSLSHSVISHELASLTISGHTGSWYVRQTAPAGNSACTAVSRSTYSLTGLSQGTDYSFAGYLDSACTTAFDTESFTTHGVKLSAAVLSVPEGSTATYTAVLTVAPTADVTVTVGAASGGDADITADTSSVAGTQNTLTFTSSNYSTAQTVTVAAAEDNDSAAGAKTLTHSVTSTDAAYSGASGAEIVATEADNEVYLAASAVQAQTATITLHNQTAQWWYKYTTPSGDTSCTNVAAGTTTASLTSRSTGTSYTYKAYSNSTCTTEIGSTAFLTKPGQTTGVAAAAADGRLKVSWTAPADTVTGHKVQWKSGAQTFNSGDRQATVASGSSYTITGLTNATAYTVRVTAYNATGDGAASAETTGTPATTVPSAPDAPGVALIGGKVRLTWKAPDDGGSAVTGYEYVKKAGAANFETNWTAIPDSASKESYTFATGLTDGTVYRFKVRAVNSVGDGGASAQSAEVTPNAVTLASSSVTFSTATLTVSNHDGPWWYKHTTPSGDTSCTPVPAGLSDVGLLRLAASTSYVYVAYSDSGCATTLATASSFTTPAASGAKTLTASNAKSDRMTLTIANHSGNWYYKYTTPNIPASPCTMVTNVTSTVADGLKASTAYVFKAYSNSDCSTELAAAASVSTVAVAAPAKPAKPAVAAGDGQVTLFWTAPEDGGAAITRYEYVKKVGTAAVETTWTAIPVGARSHTVTGLANGSAHQFQLRAVNSRGNGTASDLSDAVTPTAGAPASTARIATTALSPSAVAESGFSSFTVKLAAAPTADVQVTVANRGGSGDDADLSASPATLVFTPVDYDVAQTVRIAAAADNDSADGTAVFTLTASSIDDDFNRISRQITATESDADAAADAGVTVSRSTLSVPEGGSATYTLVLDDAPSHPVTVAIAKASGGDADITVSPASIVFPVEGWDVARTVTVSAAEDNDTARGTATVNHTATSSDTAYNGITIAGVSAAEADNDAGVTLSATRLTVDEGSSATYTVVLDSAPSADVVITLGSLAGGDSDITADTSSDAGIQSTLTFTSSNYSTAQTVTVAAATDSDSANGAKTITHTAASTDGGYNGIAIPSLLASEADSTDRSIVLSAGSLTVTEGSSATYTVKLSTAPTSDVTVTVANRDGLDDDDDITADTSSTAGIQSTLTFTSSNYSTAQTVTVAAASDSDKTDGIAVITHSASGGGYDGASASLAATEDDDDSTNRSPTSANFTLTLDGSRRFAFTPSAFPFADPDAVDGLDRIRIVGLPNSDQGTLGTALTGIANANIASVGGCVGNLVPVLTGTEIVNSLRKVLYFCPKPGFVGTDFWFQVFDTQGQVSANAYSATLVGRPAWTSGAAARPGYQQVKLTWDDPRNPYITGYEYRQKSSSDYGQWTSIPGSDATTTGYTVTGLTNSTAYTFQVRARSIAGAAALESAEVTATPSASVKPAKPTGLQVLAIGRPSNITTLCGTNDDRVAGYAIWDDPQDPSITAYKLEWSWQGTGWGNPTNRSNTNIPGSNASTTDDRFCIGTNSGWQLLRVSAVNAAGTSEPSDSVRLDTDDIRTDDAQVLLSAVTPGNRRVRLDWAVQGMEPASVANSTYRYCRKVTMASEFVRACAAEDLKPISDDASDRSYITDPATNAFANGQRHTLAVATWKGRANETRDAWLSNSRSVYLPAQPSKPTGLSWRRHSDSIVLSWTDPGDADIDFYEYQQKAGEGSYGSWMRMPGSNADTTSFAVTDLTPNTAYRFKIRAVVEYPSELGGNLNGVASDETSATPLGLVFNKRTFVGSEGGTATYTVKLSKAPASNVTVRTRAVGDSDITVDTDSVNSGSQSTLVFTSTNWSTAQTVTVAFAEDADQSNGRAAIEHTVVTADTSYSAVLPPPDLATTEQDNDILTATAITRTTATLVIVNWPSTWYYKKTAPAPAGSCSPAQTGTTVDLASLTTGTGYTYKAYSDSSCANEVAAASFTTIGATLAASSITESAATLTITNYTGGSWYHKKTAPTPAGSCSSEITGTTDRLTTLTGNVAYTYKAYSDSACTTEVTTDATDADFTTLDLAASDIRQTTATLALRHYTGTNWYYKKTAPTPAGSCSTPASVSSGLRALLTNLSASSSYTYKAYSDSNCSSNNVLATKTFSTLAPIRFEASAVTQTKAMLTLSNYAPEIDWYYKKTLPTPAGSCLTADFGSSGRAVNLSNLTGGTSYTYKAYSDSSCSTELTTDATDAEFTTLNLTAGDITDDIATLTISNYAGTNWYHKKTAPTPAGDCSSANTGTTASLTSLTVNTSYTYKAYSASGCTSSALLASVTFSTLARIDLNVSSVTQTTGTLTISSWTDDWYYKYTAPSGGTCSSAVTGATADLTTLTAGTDYTFEAYRDSSCNTDSLASATFTTIAGASLTASKVKQTTARLTVLNNGGGTWYYKQTSPTAGTCKSADSTPTSGGFVDLTGLTGGRTYTYKAYSASGCSSSELASETFTTMDLVASAVTQTKATLTISQHTGDWYWKKTAPTPAGTCSSTAVTDVTLDVTDLTGGAGYTYKAYSDSGCSSELASVSFTTMDLVASAVTQTKATLTISGRTGSWYWKKTAPSAGDCSSTAVAGDTLPLSSLEGGETYTYKAYSASGCASAALLASESFTTMDLAASAVTQTGATLTISGRTGSWYHKYTTPSGGTCSSAAVTGDTHDLSDLDGGTSYTYRAYSASGCSASALLASVSFTTMDLVASAVTQTGATLTISGHSGNWYHKKTAPTPAGSCSSQVSDTTSDLTDLTGGARYTFKAYSDSGCSSELASVSFTTMDLVASAVTQTKATLTISGRTGSWYWKKTAPSAGDCSSAAVAGDTLSLSSLEGGETYTYKAYSASGCASAALLASESFTTMDLAASAVTQTGATLTISGRTGSWYHKYSTPAGGSCSSAAVTGDTHDLSDLDGGTSYTYRAYSASGCSASALLASVSFTTMDLVASAVTQTGATLTISGHTGNWYHKKTAPTPAGSCSSQVSATTSDLTDLTANIEYTYKAYSDSGCTAELAAETFTTLPPIDLRASAVAQTTATLTLRYYTGTSWYHKHTVPSGGTCSSTAITGDTSRLTDLTSGTEYTYKAYSDSGCTTELTTDETDAEFTTSVTPPSGGPPIAPSLPRSQFALRFGGADRYETATVIGQAFLDRAGAASGTVLLASGAGYADALAASVLSGHLKAPLLLTRHGELPSVTERFMAKHRVRRVIVLGGVEAVSDAVADAVKALSHGPTVERIGGADRYETAALIARRVATVGDFCGTNESTVLVASGTAWPDALAAGPLAWVGRHPILLTYKEELSPVTRDLLAQITPDKVILMGGTAAVSARTEAQMTALGIDVLRLAGADRYATASLLAEHTARAALRNQGRNCLGRSTIAIATGMNPADASSSAPLLGYYRSPLLLTLPDSLPAPTLAYVESVNYRPGQVPLLVIGGTSAVGRRPPNQVQAARG